MSNDNVLNQERRIMHARLRAPYVYRIPSSTPPPAPSLPCTSNTCSGLCATTRMRDDDRRCCQNMSVVMFLTLEMCEMRRSHRPHHRLLLPLLLRASVAASCFQRPRPLNHGTTMRWR